MPNEGHAHRGGERHDGASQSRAGEPHAGLPVETHSAGRPQEVGSGCLHPGHIRPADGLRYEGVSVDGIPDGHLADRGCEARAVRGRRGRAAPRTGRRPQAASNGTRRDNVAEAQGSQAQA